VTKGGWNGRLLWSVNSDSCSAPPRLSTLATVLRGLRR
jgi:hypothetical protein